MLGGLLSTLRIHSFPFSKEDGNPRLGGQVHAVGNCVVDINRIVESLTDTRKEVQFVGIGNHCHDEHQATILLIVKECVLVNQFFCLRQGLQIRMSRASTMSATKNMMRVIISPLVCSKKFIVPSLSTLRLP